MLKIKKILAPREKGNEIASLYPARFLGSSEQVESVVEGGETEIRENERDALVCDCRGLQSSSAFAPAV